MNRLLKKRARLSGDIAITAIILLAIAACETGRHPEMSRPEILTVTTDAHIWLTGNGCACAVKTTEQGDRACSLPTPSDPITIKLTDASGAPVINKILWKSKDNQPFQLFFDPLAGAPDRRTQTGQLLLTVNSKVPAQQARVPNVEYKYTVVIVGDQQWNPVPGCSALDPKIIVQP